MSTFSSKATDSTNQQIQDETYLSKPAGISDAYQAAMLPESLPSNPMTNGDDVPRKQPLSTAQPTPRNTMDYSHVYTRAPPLASSRYNRQMLIPSISISGQEKIARAKILIIGLGGLGSPAALYLAGAGVGTLGLLDDDVVEQSNLHRQVVHRETSVDQRMTKVASALRGCRELNSEIELVGHEMRLDVLAPETAGEVMRLVGHYDIVLDCTDNPATRYLVSDLCVVLGKMLVSGAAQRLEGQVLVLSYPLPDGQEGRGPCYRCVFPTPPSPEMVKGCGEIGILGPVVGTIGTLMATEVLRLVVKGVDEARKPSMLLYNAWPADPRSTFRSIGLRGRRMDCVACGEDEAIKEKGMTKIVVNDILAGRLDYVTFCGVAEDVKLLPTDERVDAAEFLYTMASTLRTPEPFGVPSQRKWHNAIVVDVREPYEVDMGPQFKMGINIPISSILRQDGTLEKLSSMLEEDERDAMIFVCPRGNDSQIAVKRLVDWRAKQKQAADKNAISTVDNIVWRDVFISDVIGGYTALDKV